MTTSESWLYETMGDAGIAEYASLRPSSCFSEMSNILINARFRQIIGVVKETSESTRNALQTLCKI